MYIDREHAPTFQTLAGRDWVGPPLRQPARAGHAREGSRPGRVSV